MIKGKTPMQHSVDTLKTKARTSASVLGSLIMSGYRGLSFQADYELVLYFIGVHLIAKSLAADLEAAKKVGAYANDYTLATITKHEILNEVKFLQNKNSKN